MIQTLVQHDIPPMQNIQLTGHKNLQSINNYSKASEEQLQNMSQILTGLANFEPSSSMSKPPLKEVVNFQNKTEGQQQIMSQVPPLL